MMIIFNEEVIPKRPKNQSEEPILTSKYTMTRRDYDLLNKMGINLPILIDWMNEWVNEKKKKLLNIA